LSPRPQERQRPESTLSAGRVGRPHGLDGSFYVTGPRPRLLALGKSVSVAGESREIMRCAGTDRRPILRLHGIDDREGAERLRGQELTLAESDAPTLADGEWWAHELVDCQVRDAQAPVGRVLRMIELPSCEALEVQPLDGGAPILIPMVKDAIRTLDIQRREIDVDLSFLGVDPPRSSPEGPDDGALRESERP
jgi:16S rRNA processing protein RimM